MRVGVADHFGWAVAITASPRHAVVDRRRILLIEPGVSPAPIHYESSRLDLAATEALVATVRASVTRASSAALDEIAANAAEPITSIAIRGWPATFPDDIATQRMPPHEARADGVMYRRILAELAQGRGWVVHFYEPRDIIDQAVARLGDRATAVLDGPRERLGPPWTKDHRMALAAIVASE